MTDKQPGITPGFEHEAKVVHDESFRTSALMQMCMEHRVQVRSLTEEKLIEMHVAYDKFPILMPIIAKKILEYYGIQGWEMKNAKRVEESGMTPEHYAFVVRTLNLESLFNKYLRSNCGDRSDNEGEATQYDQMKESFGSPETARQNVVVVDEEATNETLIKWFSAEVDRLKKEISTIDEEMNKPTFDKNRKDPLSKRRAEYQKSLDILTVKLEKLDEDNTSRSGESQ